MYSFFQRLEDRLCPVAVLPAAAIIVGIGNGLTALGILPTVAAFFTAGSTILEQLGILLQLVLL